MWTSGAALAIGLFVLTPITAAAAAVRTVDSRAEALIAEGAQRSATFRGLIDRLDRTRWIVFVQRGRCRDATWSHGLRASPLGPPGCLIHRVGTFEGHPYLIVRIDTRYSQTLDHEISLLAHELQHAIEAAEAPDVIDTQTLTTFFERISEVSFRSPGLIGYETGAAVRVGRQVLTELRKRPLKPDAPRHASSSSDRPQLTQ